MSSVIVALIVCLFYIIVVDAYLVRKEYSHIATRQHWRQRISKFFSGIEEQSITGKLESSSQPSGTFDWEKQWYPLAIDVSTDRGKPQALQLLGKELVLWHDGEKWRAFDDNCPHRGVKLSEGRIEKSGELLCSYHAWRWNGEGQCTRIPQAETKEMEMKQMSMLQHCVPSFPVKVEQGLIWVWGMSGLPGSDAHIEAALKMPRLIEELYDEKLKHRVAPVTYNHRDIPYGWDMFMENVLDPAHVPVSHHNIVGNRYKDADYIDIRPATSVTSIPIKEGGQFDARYPADEGFAVAVRNRVKGPLENSNAINDFRPPCLNKIETTFPDGAKTILALYATPTKPGYARHIGAQVFVRSEKNCMPAGLGFFALPLPAWFLHMTAALFLHQDQVFLHHQQHQLYSSHNYAFGHFEHVNTSSAAADYQRSVNIPNIHDRGISQLRKWIATVGKGGPRWGGNKGVSLGKSLANLRVLSEPLPSKELFNVYDQHTKDCAICQRALKNIKIVKNGSLLALGALAMRVTWMRRLSALSVLAAGLLASITFVASAMIKLFHSYEFHHQSNN